MGKIFVTLYKQIFGKTLTFKTVRLASEVKEKLNKELVENWDNIDGYVKDDQFMITHPFGFWTRLKMRPKIHGVIHDKGGWTEIDLFVHLGVAKTLVMVVFSFIFFFFSFYGIRRGNINNAIELIFILCLLPFIYKSYQQECELLLTYLAAKLDANILDE